MNLRYYRSPIGHGVMDARNHCADILDYLARESELVRETLAKKGYGTLVEFGCDTMRMLPCAVQAGADYLGIDARQDLIAENRLHCQATNAVQAQFVCAKIEDMTDASQALKAHLRNFSTNPLAVLPFNFLGNLQNPIDTCVSLLDQGCDVVVSSFNPTSRSRTIRDSYYKKCRFNPIYIELPGYGHVFYDADNTFMSVSMHASLIRKLFLHEGFAVEVAMENEVSYALLIQRKRSRSAERLG